MNSVSNSPCAEKRPKEKRPKEITPPEKKPKEKSPPRWKKRPHYFWGGRKKAPKVEKTSPPFLGGVGKNVANGKKTPTFFWPSEKCPPTIIFLSLSIFSCCLPYFTGPIYSLTSYFSCHLPLFPATLHITLNLPFPSSSNIISDILSPANPTTCDISPHPFTLIFISISKVSIYYWKYIFFSVRRCTW